MSTKDKIQALSNTVVKDMVKELIEENYDEQRKKDHCKDNGTTWALVSARVSEENSSTNTAMEGHKRKLNKIMPTTTSQEAAKSDNVGSTRRDTIRNKEKSDSSDQVTPESIQDEMYDRREQCEEDTFETGEREHRLQNFQISNIHTELKKHYQSNWLWTYAITMLLVATSREIWRKKKTYSSSRKYIRNQKKIKR